MVRLSQLTIGKQIGLGFASILVLLLLVGSLAGFALRGISTRTDTVVDRNELVHNLAAREIDHLNWAGAVSELLTDESITELSVQTDDHLCAFGHWLYGDERTDAEAAVPSLVPPLAAIESVHQELHESAIGIGENFRGADAELPALVAARQIDHLRWAAKFRDTFLRHEAAVTVQTDPTKCALGMWMASESASQAFERGSDEYRAAYEELTTTHAQLHGSAQLAASAYRQIHPGLEMLLVQRLGDHERWAKTVSEAILAGRSDLGVQTDPTQCAYGRFLASPERESYSAGFAELRDTLAASEEPHRELHAAAIAIEDALAAGGDGTAVATETYVQTVLPLLATLGEGFRRAIDAEAALVAGFDEAQSIYESETAHHLEATLSHLKTMESAALQDLVHDRKAQEIYLTRTRPALAQVQEFLRGMRADVDVVVDEANEGIIASVHRTSTWITAVGAMAIVFGLALAFFISRGIARALTEIARQLAMGSEQTSSASSMVAQMSQDLAAGATEQSASVQEMASSMEEISAMTLRNCQHASTTSDAAEQCSVRARSAQTLANEVRELAARGSKAMDGLSESMDRINSSSEETVKIIGTIDDIAFQTNLLALNAAVEAARAGDAGSGFAVVAEEVRNLAQQSAKAATDTAEMIESSRKHAVSSVEETRHLLEILRNVGTAAEEASATISDVAGSIDEQRQLIGEIASAGKEQADGTESVNSAISQVDVVTQRSAANAEESAAAAEELSAQANSVHAAAADLARLVGGVDRRGK